MTVFFSRAVQPTADQIPRPIPATAVKRLVDYNWDGVERYPTLNVSNLRARNLSDTLTALSQLATANVVAPYPELAQHIARELGLPQPPEKQGIANSE